MESLPLYDILYRFLCSTMVESLNSAGSSLFRVMSFRSLTNWRICAVPANDMSANGELILILYISSPK